MQPHYALIKFLIRIRDEKILIIHLEETHQLAMHNFRVNTFQLLPDLILLASDLEKRSIITSSQTIILSFLSLVGLTE